MKGSEVKYSKFFVNIVIVSLAISPAFALGEGNRNLFLICLMMFSPFLLVKYPIIIPKVDLPLILLAVFMVAFPLVFHSETVRWSTLLYSCLFIVYFMAFTRGLYNSSYTLEKFAFILKYLLYAYCVVLIIQQFCVITGLPIFNKSNYSVLEPFKLNSLSAEPSHSARIIPILTYIYICCQKKILGKGKSISLKDSIEAEKWVWFSFFWTTLTMLSTTAFLFMFLVFAKFVSIKKIIPSVSLIGVIVIFFVLNSENKTIKRFIDVVQATATLNEQKIITTDHSASFRIVPSIQGAKAVGVFSLDDWVGHGVDADQK